MAISGVMQQLPALDSTAHGRALQALRHQCLTGKLGHVRADGDALFRIDFMRNSRQRKSFEKAVPDETPEVLLDPARERRAVHEKPELHVPSLRRLSEVGGGYQRLPTIDDDTFGVQCVGRCWRRLQGSRIVVDTGQAGSGPLILHEVIGKSADHFVCERGIAPRSTDIDA